MREMRDICERDDIKLHSTVPYHRASNGVAECVIEVLTNAVRAMLHGSMTRALPKSQQCMFACVTLRLSAEFTVCDCIT